jgi:hypothetical protein
MLSDTEMQIKIAEACGWKELKDKGSHVVGKLCSPDFSHVPHYLNSLDAIQSAVLAQDEEFQAHFDIKLQRIEDVTNERHLHQLTARDWAEAFIETLRQLGRLK